MMVVLFMSLHRCVTAEIDTDHSTGKLDNVPPVSAEQVNHLLIGRMKGIQGHCNSCYMDAALFGSGGRTHNSDFISCTKKSGYC